MSIDKNVILEYLKTPAVLVTKENVPYEFVENKAINLLKKKRFNNMPFSLYAFSIDRNLDFDIVAGFAGGAFENYITRNTIYK